MQIRLHLSLSLISSFAVCLLIQKELCWTNKKNVVWKLSSNFRSKSYTSRSQIPFKMSWRFSHVWRSRSKYFFEMMKKLLFTNHDISYLFALSKPLAESLVFAFVWKWCFHLNKRKKTSFIPVSWQRQNISSSFSLINAVCKTKKWEGAPKVEKWVSY